MLPNWIIAGAPKTATSSLFRWLVDHPQAAGSAEKETYYFVDPGTHMFQEDRNFARHGLAGYETLFKDCPVSAKVVVESTPGYMYSETALRELPRLPTQPKFIFVLREPVAQLQSLFVYFQQNWNWIDRDLSFADFIAAVDEGKSEFKGNELAVHALRNAWYPDHLHKWRAAVGRERMLVLLFDDLVSDSRATMQWVARQLGIDPAFYDDYEFPAENVTYEARFGALQDFNIWIRSRLPQGRLYEALRRLYRAANTRPAKRQNPDEEVVRELTERYAPMLVELERDFQLDLTTWRKAAEQRGVDSGVAPDAGAQTAPAARRIASSRGF